MYVIIERNAWSGHCPVHASDGATVVMPTELSGAVEALTGRSFALGIKSVSDALRRNGRVYIAAFDGRPGVVVEALNHPAIP